MDVNIQGNVNPTHAVVSCVHGDESCGWHAFNRLRNSEVELLEPVKFILANKRAFKIGRRYCDVDLNRVSMPGDPESQHHEERVASQLAEELEGMRILDIHSTEAGAPHFAITVGRSSEEIELARATGFSRIVDMSHVGGILENQEGVVIECGQADDEEAANVAYEALRNFLAVEGITSEEGRKPPAEIFEVYDRAEGADFEFTGEPFELVEEGEIYARKRNQVKQAEESFYPVLMSGGTSYDFLGFKARKVGTAP